MSALFARSRLALPSARLFSPMPSASLSLVEGDRRLERAEEALRNREITFAAFAKVAPVGIMRFDSAGRCHYVNDRWSEISGLSIDEAIGDGWQESVHPHDRVAVMERWWRFRDADEIFREEYRLARADGSIRWVLAEGVPLRDYSGEPRGFIRVVTDITEHRELEAELTAARAELEQRVHERTADLESEMRERQKLECEVLEAKENEQRRFSQDLHDGLGQSLTGILFRALALQRDLEAEQSPHAANASKIGELVNDTIAQAHDLARGVQPVPLRPDGLMLALEKLVHEVCRSHLANCAFECEEPIHVSDHSVATHLYRIAQEALTNSIKHSGAKQITLRLRRRENDCALLVQDDGNGISNGSLRGAGRGLNIMHHRARLIGAMVTVRSEAPKGTTVECLFKSRDPYPL